MGDDNGSESVTPEELYAELHALDSSITMAQIIRHIKDAEDFARTNLFDQGETSDEHCLDFEVFCRLFPQRVARLKQMQDRMNHAAHYGEHLDKHFSRFVEDVDAWIKALDK